MAQLQSTSVNGTLSATGVLSISSDINLNRADTTPAAVFTAQNGLRWIYNGGGNYWQTTLSVDSGGLLNMNGLPLATRSWVQSQGYLTSGSFLSLSGGTISGNLTVNHTYGNSQLENGNGLVINGNYTNGQYSHRFRKWDDGGGVPLYMQFTSGTANSWSNLVRFGPWSSDGSYFRVFGGVLADGSISSSSSLSSPYYYVTPGAGYGIGLWNSSPDTYGITMGTTSTYGYIYNTSEYNLVFNMMNGASRGFLWRNDNGVISQLSSGGWQMWRGEIYPGYNNTAAGGQSSYYIYGNTANSGLRTNGAWLVNGNIYWGNAGIWLTDWFNQNVKTNANPTFNTLTLTGSTLSITGAAGQVSFMDSGNVWTGYVGFSGNLGILSFPGRNVKINSGYNGTITLETGVSGYNSGLVSIPYGALNVDNGSITTGGYVYTNYSTRVGEIWGYGGLYRSSGDMMFGTEGAGWRFYSGNSQKLYIGTDGNIWMSWLGDYISNRIGQDVRSSASPTFASIYTNGGLSTNGGNNLLGVQSPGGASRANGGSTETGAFKITFPAGIPVYGMFKLVIHIYEYGQRGNGYEIHCGGHMYPNYMYNRFQVQYGSSNSPLNVRYGNDGTYGCIWIGDTNTTWSYPQIWVSEFMMGYSNTSWTTWRSGWNISLVTSYGNSGAMDGPYTCDFGYAASAGSASTSSQVSINYNNDSNSTYQLLWGSGNSVYGTGGVYVNPYDDRVYANYFSSAYYMDVYTSAGSDYLRITDNQVYRPGGGGLYLNWSSNANVFITGPSGGNVGVGNNSPSYKMHVSGDIYANGGWLRVSGSSGLYFESYGGGWRMTDSSYIRTYNSKALSMEGASVDYVGSIYMNGGVYISTDNTRNLRLKGTASSDMGIVGIGSGNQFAFQVYGDGGGNYGFLDSTWGSWNLRKNISSGNLFMNNDSTYYLNTNSFSYLNQLGIADWQYIGGQTSNGQSNYQWDGATYRNPGDWTARLIVRRDNASTGINGAIPSLVLFNNNGGDQTTVSMVFATNECTTGSNSVNLAGIIAKKEAAGNCGGWSPGSLTFFVKDYGTRRDALTISTAGNLSTPYTMYAAAFRGNANVAGTGEAVYAPAGLYSTGTNWLYGTMYLNGNTVYDADSFQLNGRYSIWGRWNTYSGYITKIAYMTFDYNSNNGHEIYHSIASTDINGSYSDAVSLNSYNDITLRLDSNNNNANSYLRISNNSAGDGTIAWIGYESGMNQNYFSGSVGISTGPRTDGYRLNMGGSIHLNGNSVDYVGSLYFSGAGHIQPNSGSYGALQMTGTRNSWAGIRFVDTEVNLMMNSNESGNYRNGYGWQFRWYNGTFYISTSGQGGGSEYTALHSGNYTSWAQPKVYQGQSDGNWQNFTNDVGEFRVDEVLNITSGNHSNHPTGVYTYGGVLSWRLNNHSFQLYASHTGDLTFKTQWGNDNYSGWRRIIHESNISSFALAYGNLTGSFGMNDNKLYLRTNGDTNHYLWNADDDYEELRAYAGTGFRVRSSGGEDLLLVYGASNGGYTYSPYSFRAPIFYDSNDTAYYLNPAGGSRLRNLYVGDSGDDWSDPGGWGTQVRFSNGPHVRFVLHARSPGIEAGMYVHTPGSVFIGSYTGHVVSLMYAGNMRMQIEDSRIYSNVYMEAAGSMRAPIFYDSNDTTYYLDPNGTSELNSITTGTRARWGEPRWWHNRQAETSDQNYWTGTNGWGTSYGNWDNAWRGGFSGWDIWGTGTAHPQGSGYIHAQGIVSGQHYANSDGSAAYGWMMVGAGDATANRYWLRGKWGGSTSGWVEMITTGNIGSQNVNYASQAGTASFAASAGNTSSISSAVGNSYTWTGIQYFQSNLGEYCGSLSGPPLQAYSTGNNSAFMSFHKSGYYAVNMGLDADSVLRIGGWSASANRWELDMSGNNTVAGSFRAPIFYDSQDTFYYLDPNGTSRLYRVQPLNLGGATLQFRSTDLAVDSGSREAVTFIDGSQVQAHVSTGNGCGGCCYNWWSSESIQVDAEKDYEFHVWVRSTGNDSVYLGWWEGDTSGNTITSNPYFHTGGINTGGTWVKFTAKLKNWRTASGQPNNNGQDRYASANNMSNDLTGTIDGVMHSNTRFVHIRLGTCYGTVSGSKTYFYGAQVREAGYDDYQQNIVIPYYNGSSWGGKLRFGYNDWGYFGIGMYGAAGEFRMSSDSGDLNLRVDGWIRSENYVSGPQVYASSGWFRNQTNNTGLYNENTTQHWSSKDNGYWDASSTTSVSSIRFWTGGHISSLRGYVYANTSNEIGFLNSGGSWSLRLTNGGDSYTTGNAYIGRHIDAQNTWGNCGCVTLFAGWNSGKVVLGNNNNGGHDYANNLGSNSVVSTNNFYCYLDITAYSDARVKDNVKIIEDPIKKVQAIRGVTFTRNDVEDKEKRHAGVIAQEVREVLPEIVSEDTNGHYSVAYGNLTSLLIEAIKEQQKQIEELKEQLKNR